VSDSQIFALDNSVLSTRTESVRCFIALAGFLTKLSLYTVAQVQAQVWGQIRVSFSIIVRQLSGVV